ncbi:hypothetical protein ACFVXE_30280 [Streptomyces sp. NPDC058231]|uniref:hypothetical protein n=1 Tax=Streptomyces sp. NPDC058231 TaxID=3346392 RepID=UPI0036EA0BD6
MATKVLHPSSRPSSRAPCPPACAVWCRPRNVQGALALMIGGGATAIALLITTSTPANEPICYGLSVSLFA